jgi:protease IV
MKEKKWLPIGIITLLLISIILPTLKKDPVTDAQPFISRSRPGIAIVDIFGPIAFTAPSQTLFPAGTRSIIKQIQDISEDDNVKAVILRINSPGGTVGASQELHRSIKALKEKRKIPILASIGDIGASGGYYAAMAADKIYANPGSLVGSIGVILGNLNIESLAKKYGIRYQVHKSGPHKDILSPWRQSSETEKNMLDSLVLNVHSQFVHDMADDRSLSLKEAKQLATGQIFTGEQAKISKLIDELGGLNAAIQKAAKLAELPEDPHIIKKNKQGFSDFLSLWQKQIGATIRNNTMPNMSLEYR